MENFFSTLRIYIQINLKVYEAQFFLSLSKKFSKFFLFEPCKAGHCLKFFFVKIIFSLGCQLALQYLDIREQWCLTPSHVQYSGERIKYRYKCYSIQRRCLGYAGSRRDRQVQHGCSVEECRLTTRSVYIYPRLYSLIVVSRTRCVSPGASVAVVAAENPRAPLP